MTKRKEVEYGPHPAGDGAAVLFHAVLAVVFCAEFVLGIVTLPLSRSLGLALVALSSLGVWFHAIGTYRHLQDWLDGEPEPGEQMGFVAPLPRDPDGPDLESRVIPPHARK